MIPAHAPDCHDECGGDYVCPRCEHRFGWCIGAYDDTPALCDECANIIQDQGDTAAHLLSSADRVLLAELLAAHPEPVEIERVRGQSADRYWTAQELEKRGFVRYLRLEGSAGNGGARLRMVYGLTSNGLHVATGMTE
jgi:hypothetical protein